MDSTPYPLGPTKKGNGINFAIYAPLVKDLEILFLHHDQPVKLKNRTGDVWHIYFENLPNPVYYQYKVDDKLIIDPFAPSLKSSHTWGKAEPLYSAYQETLFDWEGIKCPNLPLKSLIIYEMHVRGYTADPKSGVDHPGTFLGLIDKIPHLIELGITAVELLPITEFNELEFKKVNPLTKETLYNYWGYSTISFMAPMNRYGVHNTELELKMLVKELHRFGIEVILDLVYNHTYIREESVYSELAPDAYYVIEEGEFNNETGCGNTLNAEHIVTQEMILTSLRRFAHEFHIDGFRFDLATILKRSSDGLIQAISDDPVLKNCKLIAEPWDLARYQVGGFYTKNTRWSEWNDRYRDTVRDFLRGNGVKKGEFASRISGSEDIYGGWGTPLSSVNFVTAHDGFTLADLVSYNDKHNLPNGEQNRDGSNNNISWNCGKEGSTEVRTVTALREKQMRNFLLALFVSKGIPMLHMGDEYGHTKVGNNNSWCQDNKISWFDWKLLEERSALFEATCKLIEIRKNEPIIHDDQFLTSEDVTWSGVLPGEPRWGDHDGFLSYTLKNTLWIAFNASPTEKEVTLPEGEWAILFHSVLNTPKIESGKVYMEPFSSLLLKRKK